MAGELIGALRELGCDTEGALRRMMGDKDFYSMLLRKYFDEWDFAALVRAVESGDTADAFSMVHSAKGVLGNLGLTPLYTPVSALTELLRGGSCDGAEALLETIAAQKAVIEDVLRGA